KHGNVLSRPVLIGRGLGFCSRSLSCSELCSELAPSSRRIPTDPRHRFGGHGGGETPGPIPNPEVKPSSADGTARATGWESRSLPEHREDRGRPSGGPDPFLRTLVHAEGAAATTRSNHGIHPSLGAEAPARRRRGDPTDGAT